MASILRRLPQFTTLQLLLLTTIAALLVGLFTTAWQLRPRFFLRDGDPTPYVFVKSPIKPFSDLYRFDEGRVFLIPITRRLAPVSTFIGGLTAWAIAWGIVRKRSRESLAANGNPKRESGDRQRLPTHSAPLAMNLCWGLMIVGGLVALSIPIVLMFTVGPLLFPTIYFSLFVGLAVIARGAARDTANLKRTAALQLANMIALDLANVVFAAMEFALLRNRSVKEYLGGGESLKTAFR
jgi:hypothetical protein